MKYHIDRNMEFRQEHSEISKMRYSDIGPNTKLGDQLFFEELSNLTDDKLGFLDPMFEEIIRGLGGC